MTQQIIERQPPEETPNKMSILSSFSIEELKNQLLSNKSITSIDYKQIKIEKEIGKGGQAIVELGTWNGAKVAIKHISKANLTKEQMKEYLNEISIMQSINDPQIVR